MKYDLEPTEYYEEFKDYFKMAHHQHWKNNIGPEPYEGSVGDDLMEKVFLYDVVERKTAGFSHIINDAFYGKSEDHPYYQKIIKGDMNPKRKYCISAWDEPRKKLGMEEWLYVFMLHRITGSGINYAQSPSGYHNTLLFDLWQCETIEQMCEMVKTTQRTFYTSVGYQFPRFPKKPEGWKRGGDRWLCEICPDMIRQFTKQICEAKAKGNPMTFREMMDILATYNRERGMAVYWFHYAAFLADIADWFPEYIRRDSMFFYGTNATECISYLAKPKVKMSRQDFLDRVMQNIFEDFDSLPYNAEDVCCDFIRWIENYIHPGQDYRHLDLDTVWSSSNILNHPKGRQKAMLHLGLIDSFNTLEYHPADHQILDRNNLTPTEYQEMVKTVDFTQPINTGIVRKQNQCLSKFFHP